MYEKMNKLVRDNIPNIIEQKGDKPDFVILDGDIVDERTTREEMEEALKDAEIIVADSLYQPICPKHCMFYELPHIAFSGRIYLKRLPVLGQLI